MKEQRRRNAKTDQRRRTGTRQASQSLGRVGRQLNALTSGDYVAVWHDLQAATR